MELWIGALNLGFLYAFMTMGAFITFRIYDFPDITVDGSFTFGAAVSAVLTVAGVNPFVALLAAGAAGAAAGCVTALIHTRLHINGLLAGILVTTGLYSINLHIMGRSNIPLLNNETVFSLVQRLNIGLQTELWACIALAVVMGIFWLGTSLFFKTDLGLTVRATGNNPIMAASTGVDVSGMKIGLALANGLVGISGCLVAQYQGFADVGMGTGAIIIGFAGVIIGESVLRLRAIWIRVLSVIIGSVIFRMMIAAALSAGMNPIDLKLMTAAFVLLTLFITSYTAVHDVKRLKKFGKFAAILQWKKAYLAMACAAALIVIFLIYHYIPLFAHNPQRIKKIGVVQQTDNGLLNTTRDSFLQEMERIGYKQNGNVVFFVENANGELANLAAIIDKFVSQEVDIVVTISTQATQEAIQKIKNRPIVFATVANPFIVGAGDSDTKHLSNVTGVYGWSPMDRMVEYVRRILPGKLRIGALWDSSQANSEFNAKNLKAAVESCADLIFIGTTISNTSEVYQGALYLVQKGIDAFILCPDHTVYSAFESVVKAARTKNIPIFTGDVEALPNGALGVLGYDYTSSGIQAAHLTDRILKGENPADIPFEKYRKLTFGLNLDIARDLGIALPPEMVEKADIVYKKQTAGTH